MKKLDFKLPAGSRVLNQPASIMKDGNKVKGALFFVADVIMMFVVTVIALVLSFAFATDWLILAMISGPLMYLVARLFERSVAAVWVVIIGIVIFSLVGGVVALVFLALSIAIFGVKEGNSSKNGLVGNNQIQSPNCDETDFVEFDSRKQFFDKTGSGINPLSRFHE